MLSEYSLQKYILQNRESALKDFNMAIEYNPDYAEAYYYRAAIKRDFKDEGFVDDYKKAIQLDPSLKAINEVSKTIDYISDIRIIEQRANITNNKITEYFVDIDLSFIIDENRK